MARQGIMAFMKHIIESTGSEPRKGLEWVINDSLGELNVWSVKTTEEFLLEEIDGMGGELGKFLRDQLGEIPSPGEGMHQTLQIHTVGFCLDEDECMQI